MSIAPRDTVEIGQATCSMLYVGDAIRLSASFKDAAGELATPAEVTLKILGPSGGVTSFTLSGEDIVEDSAGAVHAIWTPAEKGKHEIWWIGSGNIEAQARAAFEVLQGGRMVEISPPDWDLDDLFVWDSATQELLIQGGNLRLDDDKGLAIGDEAGKFLKSGAGGVFTPHDLSGSDLPAGSVPMDRLEEIVRGIIGRAYGTGSPEVISPAADGEFLRQAGGELGFGGIDNANLPSIIQAVEGTFTPEPTFTTTVPGDINFVGTATGWFRRAGNLVFISWSLVGVITYTAASSGSFGVAGLPYAVGPYAIIGVPIGGQGRQSGITLASTAVNFYNIGPSAGGSAIFFARVAITGGSQLLTNAHVPSGANVILEGSMTYPTL